VSENLPARGRPEAYTREVADKVLEALIEKPLRAACEPDGMPAKSTVMKWVALDVDDFSDRYAQVMRVRALAWSEELVDIADERGADPQDRRVRIDTRKWLLSKVLPKVYGDKVEHEVTGRDGGPVEVTVTHRVVDARSD
jgi:hypothetical protein